MTSFPKNPVKVTLTGEQWTTILARLARPSDGLSLRGRAVYRAAADSLAAQLKAASDLAESQELAVAALKSALEEPNWPARLEGEPRPNPRTIDGGPAMVLMLHQRGRPSR